MKKAISFVILFVLLALTSLNTSIGSSAPVIDDKVVDQKSIAIISGIYGIDLPKYQLIVNASGISPTAAPLFGPNATREFGDYTLVNSEGILYFNFNFVNGNLWYCTLSVIKGKPIYAPTVSDNVITQSKNILSKYQSFATKNYAGDTSYISLAENMLGDVSELENTVLTSSEAKMEIKNRIETSSNSKDQVEALQFSQIKMYFSMDGSDYPSKSLSLQFLNGSLYDVCDTWGILSIGAPNLLSRQEVLDMAWTAANNFNLSFISENGSIYEVKPDLTNAIVNDIHLSYTLRNSTQLHPLWFIYIFFNQSINGDYGIQVSIWGDTKEVYNCQALTTLGTPDIPSTPLPSDSSTGPTQDNALWFVLFGLTVTVVAAALIVWRVHTSKH